MMLNSIFLFLNMGTPEIMLIMAVVLLLFGGKKLPELARGLGKGIREFKDASDGVKAEIHRNINSVHDDIKVDVSDTSTSTEPQTDQTQSKL
jgi:sec-independent protein translocase protein TatA